MTMSRLPFLLFGLLVAVVVTGCLLGVCSADEGAASFSDSASFEPESRDRDRAEVRVAPGEQDFVDVESAQAEFSAATADWWSYPVSGWSVSQHFGVWRSGYGYHLGDDVLKPAYTVVRNARWGYVRHVGLHTGYGWVVIIESPREWEPSTDPRTWRNPVCQVYGHLRYDSYLVATKAKLNRLVDRGWVVGRLGTSYENGGWTPHLHYGIRKGCYTTSWVYWGYTTSSAVRESWYHPCTIISQY